jgi:hypothetical protein
MLDVENGWLNRFMFAHSEIVRVLPFGGEVDADRLRVITRLIRKHLDELDERPMAEYFITAGTQVGRLWAPWYSGVRFGTGSIPALTRRQHVHVARTALILAVVDGVSTITVDHLLAAQAWSDYLVATVEYLFGGVVGKAAQLLQAIREAGPDGLDGTGQRNVFHRNVNGHELDALREELEARHLIHSFKRATGGRPALISVAISALRLKGLNVERSRR